MPEISTNINEEDLNTTIKELTSLATNTKDSEAEALLVKTVGLLSIVLDAHRAESKSIGAALSASIIAVVEVSGGSIYMQEIEAEYSPVVESGIGFFRTVEQLGEETVEVYTHVDGIRTNTSTVRYEDLDNSVLKDILSVLEMSNIC